MSGQDHTDPGSPCWTSVNGVFFRAIDPVYRQSALAGSRTAGRYSDEHQPTLYLSASPDGVAAAMMAHKTTRHPALEIVHVDVRANRVFDLRDPRARERAGVDIDDAMAPWQAVVAEGGTPPSWDIRNRLEARGAHGLIDPSRTAPGLWHLVLFAWNCGDAPQVTLADPSSV